MILRLSTIFFGFCFTPQRFFCHFDVVGQTYDKVETDWPGVGDELGGYKGYSWSVVVELLSIAFQNGDFGPQLTGVDASGAFFGL